MIQEGQRIPDARLQELRNGQVQDVSSRELFDGRTVVVFGLPGAFTPTCSTQHLPRYDELAPAFRELGVDELVCVSVNDPYVMHSWGEDQSVHSVRLVADGNGEFAGALGLLRDMVDKGMGRRSRRYSMLVRDGRVAKLFLEPDKPGDPYTVSDADSMLRHLGQVPRPHIAVLSKPGCPYCAKARELLDQAGLIYTDLPIADATRGRVLSAVTGQASAPQVFVDGKLIGGAKELEKWLAQRAAVPEAEPA